MEESEENKSDSFEEFISRLSNLDGLGEDEVAKWVDGALAMWLVPQEPVEFHQELRDLMVSIVRKSHGISITEPLLGYITAILNRALADGAMNGMSPTFTMLYAFILGYAASKLTTYTESPEGGG